MQGKRVALVTGANQGIGFQIAKELVANDLTVLVGSRDLSRGERRPTRSGRRPCRRHCSVVNRKTIRGLYLAATTSSENLFAFSSISARMTL